MTNIILCGGSGTRLWPISRTLMPKQFVKLFDTKSLFQLTVERNTPLCNEQFIVSNAEQYFLALDQLGELHKTTDKYLLEPVGLEALEAYLHEALIYKQEVVFIPLVTNFDFSDAHIIHLFNARSNLIIVENNLLNKTNRWIKTIIDTFFSLLIFPLLLMLIGFIALLIKREDGGTVFFKQIRLGKDSKEFVCYKFRSMQENSDDLLQDYLVGHPEEIENYEIYHKYENDPRITRIGTFLRKTSLDELPQIFNVLKGEMSLIGPRPYMPNERSKMGDNIDIILAVKPGITGLWQVSGRNDVDFSSRVDLDVWYVRNWSVWKDIVILIKTAQVVLGRKGAL